jgi:hypothetical protein
MTLLEIREGLKELFCLEKFQLVQQLVDELAQEEQTVLHLDQKTEHGSWSQHDAFEAAAKLQELLEKKV